MAGVSGMGHVIAIQHSNANMISLEDNGELGVDGGYFGMYVGYNDQVYRYSR